MTENSESKDVRDCRVSFTCVVCGKVACEVELRHAASMRNPNIKATGFGERILPPGRYDDIREAIISADITELSRAWPECVPRFCLECQKCYCSEHWKMDSVTVHDSWSADVTHYYKCPEGHRKAVSLK